MYTHSSPSRPRRLKPVPTSGLLPGRFLSPDFIQFLVTGRKFSRVSDKRGDREADTAFVRSFETFDQFLGFRPGEGECHLVIIGLAEDAIAIAGQDHLTLIGFHRTDD